MSLKIKKKKKNSRRAQGYVILIQFPFVFIKAITFCYILFFLFFGFQLETIRSVAKKELDLPVTEIKDEEAKLDGGDVLFTGREFFVGLTERTNEAGAKAVAATFPEYSCIPITVTGQYRLKNLVSVAGPDLLCVASTKPAQDILKVQPVFFFLYLVKLWF